MSRIFNFRKYLKSVFGLVVLLLGFSINPFSIQASSSSHGECLRLVEKFDLLKYRTQGTDKQSGVLNVGDGVTLVLASLKAGDRANSLTIRDQGKKVTNLRGELLLSTCFRLESGKARYWVVETWDGGAHCCFIHRYFCRPAKGMPVRDLGGVHLYHGQEYLSKEALKNLSKKPLWKLIESEGNLSQKQIICLKGQPYIQYVDNRFAYFGTCYASSKIMFFPVFYQLSPNGLKPSNKSFKGEYLQRIALLDEAIRDIGAKDYHSTTKKGYLSFYAYDQLWILITARTIHYLVAREESQAWETLKRDMKKYYGTVNGLGELKKEIKATMAVAPY